MVCIKCGRNKLLEDEETLKLDKDRCVCCYCWVVMDRAEIYKEVINNVNRK